MNSAPPTSRPTAGYTLLELVVAIALATILLVIVIQFGLGQASTNQKLIKSTPVEPWLERLQHQLQMDYRSVQSIRADSRGWVLRGYPPDFASAPGADRLLDVPAIVRYDVRSESELGGALIRSTQILGKAEIVEQLLARRVKRIVILVPLKTDVPPAQLPVRIEWWHQGALRSRDFVLVRGSGRDFRGVLP